MPSVTADSNIYVSALHFGGVPLLFLNRARAGVLELAVSPAVLAEVRRVLSDKFRWENARLDEALAQIAAFTTQVRPTETIDAVPDDPDDNRILECAVAAASDTIVTGDRHLLGLRDYNGIRIVRVAEYMAGLPG